MITARCREKYLIERREQRIFVLFFFLLRETCQIIKVPVMLISPLLYSEDYDKLSFGKRQLYLTQRHMETNVCGKQTIVFNGKAWRKNGQSNRLLCGKEQGSTGGAFEGGGSQAA